jgi:hypothetical protein
VSFGSGLDRRLKLKQQEHQLFFLLLVGLPSAMAELLSSGRRQFRPPFSNPGAGEERGGNGEAHHRLTFAGHGLYGKIDRAPSGEAHGARECAGGRERWAQVEELGELGMAKESSSSRRNYDVIRTNGFVSPFSFDLYN